MVTIKAFRALRPLPEKASLVAAVPYDVICKAEARSVIANNPLSFLRVSLSEAEFHETSTPSDEQVFSKSVENLQKFIKDGVFIQEKEPSIYVYRLSSDKRSQTGIVACCSLDEYERGIIKPHETTRPDKVKNRMAQMLALKAHTGLIFLAFRNNDRIRQLIEEKTEAEPIYDFYCDDLVRQTIWKIQGGEEIQEAFSDVEALYIADGHHRLESAAHVRRFLRAQNPNHTGEEEYNFVMAGIFPAEQLQILPYNRVVKDLNNLSEEEFLERLKENFSVSETSKKQPSRKGEFCMYLGKGKWFLLRFLGAERKVADKIEELDVSILQNSVLSPILGINDPRTDERIDFIGGAFGVEELEKQVDAGRARVAFSLFPTSMEELFEIADAGKIMPPKSTWFEPKLKDGLLIHLFGETYESNANNGSF